MNQLDKFLDVAEFVLHDNSSATSDFAARCQPPVTIFGREHAVPSFRASAIYEPLEDRYALSDDSWEERFRMGAVPLSPERTFVMHDWQLHSEQPDEKDSVTSTVLGQHILTNNAAEVPEGLRQHDGAEQSRLQTYPPVITQVIISFNKDQTDAANSQEVDLKSVSERGDRSRRINNRGKQPKQKTSIKTAGRPKLRQRQASTSQERSVMRGRQKPIKKYNMAIKRRGRKPKVNNEDIALVRIGRPPIRKPQVEVEVPPPIQIGQIRYIYKRKVGRPRKNEILIQWPNQSK